MINQSRGSSEGTSRPLSEEVKIGVEDKWKQEFYDARMVLRQFMLSTWYVETKIHFLLKMCLEDGPSLSLVSSNFPYVSLLSGIYTWILIWHQNILCLLGWTTVWAFQTTSFSCFSSPTPCCTVYSLQQQSFSISWNSGWWVSSVEMITRAQHLIMESYDQFDLHKVSTVAALQH